ncbi:uncharacterized protein LOC131619585 [Vicia villosa]|uniref:uncharacterized protein LOC131619585 n=1 Tax=Vicia villosa TaxID=3911 RepID=UPI00273C5FFC|nr:uncharacterized protein LOC131619585 [Vicia villosa]
MEFGEKWLRWMESTIFSSDMSVLINGSTTKEFKVEKGLRQGDPLSPFLFVLVTDVLSTLMRKAIINGDFHAFKINEEEEISDTFNLWSMKAVLRGFKVMSGLRINFKKSNIYEINVGNWYLEAASSFLSCKVDKLLFKFLGVKAPSKVLNEITSIQRKFLWGGCDIKRSICWVRWDSVCKSREEGGLGVKNVEVMNAALLSKWKWRILSDEEVVWRRILESRYNNVRRKVLIGAVSCVVGNGRNIPFWYGCWADEKPLMELFPDLFTQAKEDGMTVEEAGESTPGGGWQ